LPKFEKEFKSAIKALDAILLKHKPLRETLFSKKRKSINFDILYKIVMETIKRLNYIDASINKFAPKLSGSKKNILRAALCMEKFLKIKPPRLPADLKTIYHKALRYDPLENVTNDYEYLALKYYHPIWFIRSLEEIIGREKLIRILEANNKPLKTKTIRINTLRTTVEDFYKKWKELRRTELPDIYEVQTNYLKKMLTSSDYSAGLFIVESFPSAVTVYILDPKPKELILDACAAPGIKTTHIASITSNKAKIIAAEIDPKRAQLLHKIGKKLGARYEIIIADSIKPPLRNNIFDKTLVDAPCSDTGVFREQPDLKWRITKKHVNIFSKIQKKILEAVIEKVRSGGTIVYSTCSLMPQEGEEVIKQILEKPNIEIEPVKPPRAEKGYPKYPFSNRVARYYPYNNTNGFFIAKLIKH